MRTAIDILRYAAAKADTDTRAFFGKRDEFIHFESGYTPTIVNSLTNLSLSSVYEPYPLIAAFTEGLTEKQETYWVDFTIPKIIIAIRATESLTESQRLESSFNGVLYPICQAFEKALQQFHNGYELSFMRSDVPFYTESDGRGNTFNDMLDGIIIKNLSMKVLHSVNCKNYLK